MMIFKNFNSVLEYSVVMSCKNEKFLLFIWKISNLNELYGILFVFKEENRLEIISSKFLFNSKMKSIFSSVLNRILIWIFSIIFLHLKYFFTFLSVCHYQFRLYTENAWKRQNNRVFGNLQIRKRTLGVILFNIDMVMMIMICFSIIAENHYYDRSERPENWSVSVLIIRKKGKQWKCSTRVIISKFLY